MALSAPSALRSLRGRDASALRGVAVCEPAPAPMPRAARGAARTVCIASGLEDASGDSRDDRDDAWAAAQRAAADIKARRPSTDWSRATPVAPKTGSSNEQLNNRYIDGGLQRDEALPLSLAYRYERLPRENSARLLFARTRAFWSADAQFRADAPRRGQAVYAVGVAVVQGARRRCAAKRRLWAPPLNPSLAAHSWTRRCKCGSAPAAPATAAASHCLAAGVVAPPQPA